MRGEFRDFGIALSLANVLFYPVWSELLQGSYGHYYLKTSPTLNTYLGVIAVVLLCAFALFAGAWFIRSTSQVALRVLGKAAFLIVFLLALNSVRSHLLRFSSLEQMALFSKIDAFLIRPAILVGAVLLLTKWRRRILWAAAGCSLALVPFAAVTFSQVAWACVKIQTGIPFADLVDRPSAPLLPVKRGGPRLIWFLFDGLDESLSFEKRPQNVRLPHMDRFRQESLYASAAYAPGGSTLESLPALLTGVQYSYTRPIQANDLFLKIDNTDRTGLWSTQPSVFSKARELGCNTALVGFYHPYCRVIGHQLTRCFWRTGRWYALGMNDPHATVPQAMFRILAVESRRLLVSIPFIWRLGFSQTPENSLHLDSSSLQERIENYLLMLEESKRVVQDPTFQLVFVHWPIPHHPYIYDRQRADFDWQAETSYEDNLALVDRTLGEMRALLEESGLWDSSSILITSDHPKISRNADREPIPFLLKLPGQRKPVLYDQRWNTLATSDLVLGLLSGKIPAQPERVVSWLEKNRLVAQQ